MSNIIDLQNERELNELTHELGHIINGDSSCTTRTQAFLYGELRMKNDDSCLLSVRVPTSLVNDLDNFAREIAFKEKRKVTRSSLVIDWLTTRLKNEKMKKAQQD